MANRLKSLFEQLVAYLLGIAGIATVALTFPNTLALFVLVGVPVAIAIVLPVLVVWWIGDQIAGDTGAFIGGLCAMALLWAADPASGVRKAIAQLSINFEVQHGLDLDIAFLGGSKA